MTKQIDFALFSWILMYFFWCYSLLNLFFQNGHKLEYAWWSPWQLGHLKECRHSLPFLVSRWGGFNLSLALQHQLNSQWLSDLCSLLHLTYLDSWILHENVACSHFQQFLHCGTPGFILASLIIAIYLLTLKHWLINPLALLLLWTSQISIQIINMSNFSNTLMTQSLETKVILSKIWFCLIMPSTSLKVRQS